jgi:ABC-type multidrug transport system permease subunit
MKMDDIFVLIAVVAAFVIICLISSIAYVFGWNPPSFLVGPFLAPRWMVALGLTGLVCLVVAILLCNSNIDCQGWVGK